MNAPTYQTQAAQGNPRKEFNLRYFAGDGCWEQVKTATHTLAHARTHKHKGFIKKTHIGTTFRETAQGQKIKNKKDGAPEFARRRSPAGVIKPGLNIEHRKNFKCSAL